ncbi:MAG: hypothetical protein COX30_04785 [Candidatus Moranbacteria bacterium CG23_combo_of_CG06-09_8_20_14_all_39_10]|nr:MAG: hypothetical protein COX30_04785 [Candidatus Moranbacteria bacterium CG23_combo_of_CG06-09_8_20_14_all_39_10]
MKKKALKFLVKLLISFGFLAWIIFRVNWQEVWALLRKIEPKFIVAYFVVLIAGIAVSAYKWKKLAEFKKINLSFVDSFKLYLTGTFVNNFMPSFIGGDTYRAYQIGKKDKKYPEAASSVVMDRLTGLFGAMILSLIFSLGNFKTISQNHILVVLNLIILVSVILVILFFITRRAVIWKKFATHKSKVTKYIPENFLKFISELTHYHNSTSVLLQAVLWSFAFGLIGLAATNYVLFLALGVKINPLDYLSVIFLISFISSIPISINNIGIKEWAYITFFGFFGVGTSVVITVAILSRFLQMFLSFLAFPVYLRGRK